jgi:hypothetical protein
MTKKRSEAGQAVLLVVLGMGIFLLGAAGLALDGSHLYAQYQMAQAAADGAAEAGVHSIFVGSNTAVGNTHGFATTAFTCASSDTRTPCYYAQTLNGFNDTTDTVSVSFPTATQVRVRVQRQVSTTLMSLLGPTASTISASGTAGIVSIASPVPIIVTHPSLSGSLSFNGNPTITITGGPRRSIQVNSFSSSAISTTACGNATVDLSGAGPNSNGADFGNQGGGATACFTFLPGVGRYLDPATWIPDPLAGVSAPPIPTIVNPAPVALADGVSGCPSPSIKACQLYSPGLYTSGINVANNTAVFKPGIYYITSNGFVSGAHGYMRMATGFVDGATGTNTGWTGNMLVYNKGNGNGDVFNLGANGDVNLVGSPSSSAYQGILFFEDRNSAAHFGPPANQAHSLGGGGAMTLVGTIYINSNANTATTYQELDLQGSSGNATNIQGEIITSTLKVQGSSGITMSLSATPSYTVRQVALVQ